MMLRVFVIRVTYRPRVITVIRVMAENSISSLKLLYKYISMSLSLSLSIHIYIYQVAGACHSGTESLCCPRNTQACLLDAAKGSAQRSHATLLHIYIYIYIYIYTHTEREREREGERIYEKKN